MTLQSHQQDNVPFYACPQFPDWISHGFTTRLGGVSTEAFTSLNLISARGDSPQRVAENYQRFHQALGYIPQQYARNQQTHSDVVRIVTHAQSYGLDDFTNPSTPFPEGDALITNHPNIALWIYNADCVPLLFCDPKKQVIAAAHAGWRGTALGIAKQTVQTMTTHFHSNPKDILVAIGPSIGPCCFSCHEDVPKAMLDALGSLAQPYIHPQKEGKYAVDLQGLNKLWLKQMGVLQISENPPCTTCHPDTFWSHRVTGNHRGSMGATISIRENNPL